MRFTAAWLAILLVGGAAVILWQRSQIASLRGQINVQGVALAGERERLDELSQQVERPDDQPGGARTTALQAGYVRPSDYPSATRADERRVILAEYRDVLARANLSGEEANRLQDLLADRVEAFLDAQDAARRQGFAEGSAAMERAVALAIGEDDRLIAELLGAREPRLAPAELPAEPALAPSAVVVNVWSQAPYSPPATDQAVPTTGDYSAASYAPYYYPPLGFAVVGGVSRPFVGLRPSPPRPHRTPLSPRLRRG